MSKYNFIFSAMAVIMMTIALSHSVESRWSIALVVLLVANIGIMIMSWRPFLKSFRQD
jgi:hypothetical protein